MNFKIAEKLGLKNVQFFGGEKEVDGVKGGSGVIGVDSLTIIRQHGSIHCLTMQLPEGAIK